MVRKKYQRNEHAFFSNRTIRLSLDLWFDRVKLQLLKNGAERYPKYGICESEGSSGYLFTISGKILGTYYS